MPNRWDVLPREGMSEYGQQVVPNESSSASPNRAWIDENTSAWTPPWKKEETAINMGLQDREWAHEDAIRQWEAEQANNAISNRVKDLEKAHLNPWLALQSNALGEGTEVARMQTSSASPKFKSDTGATLGAILGVITTMVGLGISAKIKSANTDKIFHNMLKINEDRADLNLLSKYKFHDYKKRNYH